MNVILTSTITPEEKGHICTEATTYADEIYAEDPSRPQGIVAVHTTPPNWDYQPDSPNIRNMPHFLTCIIAGMKKASFNGINYDKILEITQYPHENPVASMSHFSEAVLKYTSLDPVSAEGSLYLHTHFISQFVPDIQKKLQNLEDLIKMTFWVFNNREEENKLEQKRRDKERKKEKMPEKRKGRKETTRDT